MSNKKNINFKDIDLYETKKYNYNYLMNCLSNRKKLSTEHWQYIIENSPLEQQTRDGWTALMLAMNNGEISKMLDEEQLSFLILNSPKQRQNIYGYDALLLALCNTDLILPIHLYEVLIQNSDLSFKVNQNDNILCPLINYGFYNKKPKQEIFTIIKPHNLYLLDMWHYTAEHEYKNTFISNTWSFFLPQEQEKLFALFQKHAELQYFLEHPIIVSYYENQKIRKIIPKQEVKTNIQKI